jgi:hypothetical protein
VRRAHLALQLPEESVGHAIFPPVAHPLLLLLHGVVGVGVVGCGVCGVGCCGCCHHYDKMVVVVCGCCGCCCGQSAAFIALFLLHVHVHVQQKPPPHASSADV